MTAARLLLACCIGVTAGCPDADTGGLGGRGEPDGGVDAGRPVDAGDGRDVGGGPSPDAGVDCASCPLGCSDARPLVCARVVPSRVAGIDARGDGDLVVDGELEVDTDACVAPAGGVATALETDEGSLCVLSCDSLQIPGGSVLRAHGSRPLVVWVDGDALVAGTIDVSARGATPGAGGGRGGDSTAGAGGPSPGRPGAQDGLYDGGGGGGGLCGGGGAGGDGLDGTGGAAGDALDIDPGALVGGSGGGAGMGQPETVGAGGAGGGALQLSVGGQLTLSGEILAAGGGGRRGLGRDFGDNAGAGGGGGSGGTVRLEAAWIEIDGGEIDVSGGGGASAGFLSDDGLDGTDGVAGRGEAAGGDGGGGAGRGGAGAGAETMEGRAGESTNGNGGGGGGGSGCVRLFDADGEVEGELSSDPTGAVSVGTVEVR